MQNNSLETTARAVTGHIALRIFHQYGEERGRCVLRGMFVGVLIAAVSLIGWEEVRKLVDDTDASAHRPPPGAKPKLVVVNEKVSA